MATYSTITFNGDPTNSINFIAYEVGGYFLNQAGASVVITELGRWKKSGNNQVHTLTVYSAAGSVLGTTSVDMSGPEPAGDFVFGDLASDITVPPGTGVYILSTETGGSESFWGQQGITNTVPFGSIYIANRQYNGISYVLSSQYPNGASQTFGPVTFKYSAPIASWTYDGGDNEYTTDGTFFNVKSALADSASKPAGVVVNTGVMTETWFDGGSTLTVPAGVTLSGDTAATSVVNMSTGAVSGYSAASITLNEGSVLRRITFNGANSPNCIPIATTTGAGTWRVTENIYNQYSGRESYFMLVQKAPSGLIDKNTINGNDGESELILSRGPDNAWQVPTGMGDANAVYIEGNIFSGSGYVNDANDNGKAVVRMNTITGTNKVDGHGRSTNSNRGVRRLEVYGNSWTAGAGSWTAMELRGGKNYVFNNTAATGSGGAASLQLTDYGPQYMSPGFQYRFQTPQNYPLSDQIGTGTDVTVNATTIGLGDYVKIASLGSPTPTDFTAFGAASNTLGIWFFATGTPTGDGTVTMNGPIEPSYVFGNLRAGVQWTRSVPSLPASDTFTVNSSTYSIGETTLTFSSVNTNLWSGNAIVFAGDTTRYLVTNNAAQGSNRVVTISPGLVVGFTGPKAATVTANLLYQYQQGNPSASFTTRDIIQSNRDFFADAGFDTNTGVVVGTTIGAAPSAAGKLNQGYWAADEGTWNTENATPGTPGYQKGQGRLYVSDNTNWVLTYTPYTYPYTGSLPPPTPVFTSAEVLPTGDELAISFSVSVSTGGGGAGGVTIAATGGAVTWTYDSGAGSDTYVGTLSRPIVAGEVVSVAYTQPGDGIVSTDDGVEVASFGAQPVANNSIVNVGQASSGLRNFAGLGAGF